MPNDHLAISKSLSMQVWTTKPHPREEVKQGSDSASAAARDQIVKLKLIELVGKVADQMATVAKAEAPAEFFLVLDSAVIRALMKFSQKVPSFKPKVFTAFAGSFVKEVAVKAQKDIIDFLSKLKDVDRIMKMEVDQIME